MDSPTAFGDPGPHSMPEMPNAIGAARCATSITTVVRHAGNPSGMAQFSAASACVMLNSTFTIRVESDTGSCAALDQI